MSGSGSVARLQTSLSAGCALGFASCLVGVAACVAALLDEASKLSAAKSELPVHRPHRVIGGARDLDVGQARGLERDDFAPAVCHPPYELDALFVSEPLLDRLPDLGVGCQRPWVEVVPPALGREAVTLVKGNAVQPREAVVVEHDVVVLQQLAPGVRAGILDHGVRAA